MTGVQTCALPICDRRGPRCGCPAKVHPTWVDKYRCTYRYPDSNMTNAEIALAQGQDEEYFRKLDQGIEVDPPPPKRERRDALVIGLQSTPQPSSFGGASSSSSNPNPVYTFAQFVQAASSSTCDANPSAVPAWQYAPITPNPIMMNPNFYTGGVPSTSIGIGVPPLAQQSANPFPDLDVAEVIGTRQRVIHQ